MPEKLMTLRELSEYLGVPEDILTRLVEDRVIPAYKIGGELLRFRKEQIDAMRREIDSRVGSDPGPRERPGREKVEVSPVPGSGNSFLESIQDFLYFNDFYIFSAVIVGILLAIIFRG